MFKLSLILILILKSVVNTGSVPLLYFISSCYEVTYRSYLGSVTTRAQFHNTLIRLKLNPIILYAKLYIFQTMLSGMFKAEYIVYLWIYINISCICEKNTVTHSKFGQQLLGLTLKVNPRLWNWAQVLTVYTVMWL